jgi:hypothetical protein
MSDMKLNLSGVKANDFDALPTGKYHVKLTDWDQTETQNAGKLPAGTPGINAEFTVQDGPNENRRLWNNFWIAESTLGFLKSFLKASGQFTEDELNSEEFSFDWDDLVGVDLVVKVGVRKYNGEDRNNINGYLPYDESTWKPMEKKTAGSKGGGGLLP